MSRKNTATKKQPSHSRCLLRLFVILTLFLSCGCQTTKIEKYDFPPIPERPIFHPLKNGATTADIYTAIKKIMIYAEEWETWGKSVQDLAGQ